MGADLGVRPKFRAHRRVGPHRPDVFLPSRGVTCYQARGEEKGVWGTGLVK